MKKLIFATTNKGKLREAGEILGERFEVVSPSSLGLDAEVEETGETIEENSRIKARHLYSLCGQDCFADDTGLEVEALGGAPGVRSARYAGEAHDDEANISKLLSELEKLGPGASRRARFRTVITLILDGREHVFEGETCGSITFDKVGTNGFGYDPVFIPDAYPGRTFAQLSDEQKNAVSHRGRALRAMAEILAKSEAVFSSGVVVHPVNPEAEKLVGD